MKSAIRDTTAQDVTVNHDTGRRLRLHLAAAVVAGLVIIGLVLPTARSWFGSEISVPLERLRVASVERGHFLRDFSVQARVVAAVSPTLFSSTDGTVTLQVNAGESVAKGDLLATVDSPEVLNELAREQSTLESLELELDRKKIEKRTRELENQQTIDLAKVTRDAAARELKRAQLSFDHGVLSRQDLEKKEDELATAEVRYKHAVQDADLGKESLAFELRTTELDVARQRLMVENLQRRADDLEIRSPVDGIVGNLAVAQKAAVAANQPLLTVVDLSAFEIELQVSESYADSLGIGTQAQIRFGQDEYSGEVSAISPEVINNQVTTRVRFTEAVPTDLRQNQRASVRIVLEERDDVLMVRRGPFYESGGGRLVYRINGDVAERVNVRTGSTSVNAIEILEGLGEGDQIIISSTDAFNGAEQVYLQD